MADRNWHTAKSMSTAINPTSDAYRDGIERIQRIKALRAQCAADDGCECEAHQEIARIVAEAEAALKNAPRHALRPKNVIGDLKHAKRQMEKLRDTGEKR